MPSSGVQTCASSEEHTSELQSHDNLVCRLLVEKKMLRSEEHTSELQSHDNLVCRLLLGKKDDSEERLPDRRRAARLLPRAAGTIPRGEPPLFFFKEEGPPELYPFPLPDALPI